ncbi:PREDICTED: uncharacterized protein LOC105120534 isoform X2 [Populus euphratica]|uniref:Uncharacterized protein LOC105120534 isoform X2 n=1 Tax=Populus euphratica TaxID=75702 RepID=A0AAJ6TT34_POPEU|nr:PREDICTED: uncharacterized protein LOC105120534 isoform X2 [Populus euphratica]
MAITETKPVKQLRELLQEQQEPFILNIYLLERGYSRKGPDSENSSRFCHVYSRKSLKRSVGHGVNISKRVNPQGSKVLRAVLKQVISIKQMLRINSSDHGGGKLEVNEKGRSNQQVAESDIFSTASSKTVFNSSKSEVEAPCATQRDSLFTTNTCYQPLNLHNPTDETTTDRKLQQRGIEDSRRLSPASGLEGIPSNGRSPFQNNNTEHSSTAEEENPSKTGVNLPKKLTEDCILSDALRKVLFYSPNEKPICAEARERQELVQSYFSPQYLKSKMVLQQTKQLLFDYVKEIVETKGREMKQQCHHKQFLGLEEPGSIIGEKTRPWDKQSVNESDLTKLLNLDVLNSELELSNYKSERRDNGLDIGDPVFDLLDSEQDWNGFELQREIGSEIGDTILGELVTDIVKNMIDFSSLITTC